jgi:TorA maturation chaperone TorD
MPFVVKKKHIIDIIGKGFFKGSLDKPSPELQEIFQRKKKDSIEQLRQNRLKTIACYNIQEKKVDELSAEFNQVFVDIQRLVLGTNSVEFENKHLTEIFKPLNEISEILSTEASKIQSAHIDYGSSK